MPLNDQDAEIDRIRAGYIRQVHVPLKLPNDVHRQALLEAFLAHAATVFIAHRGVPFAKDVISEAATAALDGLELWYAAQIAKN